MKIDKLLVCAAVIFCIAACSEKSSGGGFSPDEPDPTPPDPPVTTTLPDISEYKIKSVEEMSLGGAYLIPCSGVGEGDCVKLVARDGSGETHTLPVENIDEEKGVSFKTPSEFIGGMFAVSAQVGGKSIDFGTTFIDVIDDAELPHAGGYTLYGRVCDWAGKPIAGVTVSDGLEVTTTDSEGMYYIASLKRRGYVFISVPSGYRVAVNRSIPKFFRYTSGKPSQYDQCNFVLAPEENTRHRVIVFTDTHLANRTDDVKQFTSGFYADLEREIVKARTEGVKLCGMSLGDLTWDEWWYKNSYTPTTYAAQMAGLDMPIFNAPGNHDNDPYVADDFESEHAFRTNIGPTYYSFNIGAIHYVQLDDTLFANKGGANGTVGDLSYTQGLSDDEFAWLAGDLKNVPAGTTVFVGMHIPYTTRYNISSGTLQFGYMMPAAQRSRLDALLADYKVHFVTGHTHIRYNNFVSERVVEHNIPAICATWWWTGKYSGFRCHMCRDGVPGGYEVFDIGSGSPDDVRWYYQPIGRSADYQFRAYDLNNCLITRAKYCPKVANNFKTVTEELFAQYACGYDRSRSDNEVLINVFNWDVRWKVEVREVETGKNLTVRQVDAYDPLHVIHFNMARMNTNSAALTFPALLTSHMFEATCSSATSTLEISVTDGFGRTYSETMKRPRELYDMSKSSDW